MDRSHSKPASREPGLVLVITPSLSFTTGCPERRSPRGANEQAPSLASPRVLSHPDPQFRVFLDSCLSSHPTSNPSADLLGLWFKCGYSPHGVGRLPLERVQQLPAVSQLRSVDAQSVSYPEKRVVRMLLRTLQWCPVSLGSYGTGHGTSLAVQWLRLCLPVQVAMGSIPGQGTHRGSHMPHSQKTRTWTTEVIWQPVQ